MATFRFDATGVSGGWLHLGSDTDRELDANIRQGLLDASFDVLALTVSTGVLGDPMMRVLANEFPYRAQLTIKNNFISSAAAAREKLRTVLRDASGGHEPSISDVGNGEAAQPDPGVGIDVEKVLPKVTMPLALIAVIAVAVAVVAVKVKL